MRTAEIKNIIYWFFEVIVFNEQGYNGKIYIFLSTWSL